MNKCTLICLIATFLVFRSYAQPDSLLTLNLPDTLIVQKHLDSLAAFAPPQENVQVYKLKPAVDVPVTAVSTAWSLYGFSQIYTKESSTPGQIQSLNKNDINGFDRWAAGKYSEKAANASDYFFNGSIPLPLLLLLDKKIRKDAARVGFLYLEAMSVTGLLYTGSVYLHDRYRPYTYNAEVPMNERLDGNSKNSFFAGHVALVGTSTFFIAKVYSDYHPHSPLNWVLYTAAAAATGATGYLRFKAGKHFPSDVLIGTAVGALSGILVPGLHKNKLLKQTHLSLMPMAGTTNGLAFVYQF